MAIKITDLPLTDLYQRKMTSSVEAAIQSKEDFSQISASYCANVCKLKCKNTKGVQLLKDEVDILIIQDHAMPDGKFDRRKGQSEAVQKAILDFICLKAGFSGLNYRITRLLKCEPTETDFPKGKAPSVTTISKCKPYLFREIERCKPKVIISLSTAVTKALGYKKLSNTSNRGEIVDGKVLITLHPRVLSMIRQNASGALWGNDYFEIIRKDFVKAAKIARGELVVKTLAQGIEEQKKNVFVAKSLDQVKHIIETINSLPPGRMVSCDTETTGLDPMSKEAKLLCIQFGWKDPETKTIISGVIPLWHRDNKWFDPVEAWKLVTPILVSEERMKIFHNGKFDILYIYHTTGVRVQGMEIDTMLMLHAKDSGGQGTFSLKTAIWDYGIELGIGGYEDLLPKLTKSKDLENEEEEEEGEEE